MKKKFEAFEKCFIELWGEYMKLHAELDTYRGKHIGDNLSNINNIINSIQEVFAEMSPALMFVAKNHAICVKAVHDYNKFVDDLKKAGAVEEPKEGIA